MADVLKGMGLTGNKLSESMRVKKVCICEHDELAMGGGSVIVIVIARIGPSPWGFSGPSMTSAI